MKKQYAGYIFCNKLNKKINISLEAVPFPVYGFLCSCGVWVNKYSYGHEIYYNKELK